MPRVLTRGYKTSEFWITVLADASYIVAASAHWIPPRYAALAGAVSSGLYAVARGWAKSSGIPPEPFRPQAPAKPPA